MFFSVRCCKEYEIAVSSQFVRKTIPDCLICTLRKVRVEQKFFFSYTYVVRLNLKESTGFGALIYKKFNKKTFLVVCAYGRTNGNNFIFCSQLCKRAKREIDQFSFPRNIFCHSHGKYLICVSQNTPYKYFRYEVFKKNVHKEAWVRQRTTK